MKQCYHSCLHLNQNCAFKPHAKSPKCSLPQPFTNIDCANNWCNNILYAVEDTNPYCVIPPRSFSVVWKSEHNIFFSKQMKQVLQINRYTYLILTVDPITRQYIINVYEFKRMSDLRPEQSLERQRLVYQISRGQHFQRKKMYLANIYRSAGTYDLLEKLQNRLIW